MMALLSNLLWQQPPLFHSTKRLTKVEAAKLLHVTYEDALPAINRASVIGIPEAMDPRYTTTMSTTVYPTVAKVVAKRNFSSKHPIDNGPTS